MSDSLHDSWCNAIGTESGCPFKGLDCSHCEKVFNAALKCGAQPEQPNNNAMDAIADLNDALAYIRCNQSGNAVNHIHAAITCLQQHQ